MNLILYFDIFVLFITIVNITTSIYCYIKTKESLYISITLLSMIIISFLARFYI